MPFIDLRHPGTCNRCGTRIAAGSRAAWTKDAGVTCEACITQHLPDATATGAVDSSKASLKAKNGRGRALKTGVPMTPGKQPKKRKRLTGNQRTTRSIKHSA